MKVTNPDIKELEEWLSGLMDPKSASFLAAAVEAAPKTLATIHKLETENKRLREALSEIKAACDGFQIANATGSPDIQHDYAQKLVTAIHAALSETPTGGDGDE